MSKDDATWLNVAYVCFLVITAYIGFCAIQTVGIQTGWEERYDWFSIASSLGGVAFGIVCLITVRGDTERHDYLLQSIAELRKVTWPSPQDVKRMTLIVCVVCGVFAVIVSAFDVVASKLLKMIIT